MTKFQKQAYELMQTALRNALSEIHNPGASRSQGLDITGHIEEVLKLADLHAPNNTSAPAHSRSADRIDGFDRDDLSQSPDC